MATSAGELVPAETQEPEAVPLAQHIGTSISEPVVEVCDAWTGDGACCVGDGTQSRGALDRFGAYFEDIQETERRHGVCHIEVARCLRRLVAALDQDDQHLRTIPLLIRVVQIEQSLLGNTHPDVKSTRARLRADLERLGSLNAEQSLAYALVLQEDIDAPSESLTTVSAQRSSAEIAASLGCSVVGGVSGAVGGAVGATVASGVVQIGVSAVCGTASLMTRSASSVLSFAAHRAMNSFVDGSMPAVAAVPPSAALVASEAAAAASTTSAAAARSVSCAIAADATGALACTAVNVAQRASVCVTSAVASSACSLAGQAAVSTSHAAVVGGWGILRSSLSAVRAASAVECATSIESRTRTSEVS
eukprot:TRINITY_DN25867_c0_g1_i1.p1 TRINITY_DN25867_c0_g1~~TRINITY_DN25867_c0_g1_i1.p1  ORF type:complete len:363 (+),score=65.90 TRINITY_DN25867_c0_g1_i1:111-1199(+)